MNYLMFLPHALYRQITEHVTLVVSRLFHISDKNAVITLIKYFTFKRELPLDTLMLLYTAIQIISSIIYRKLR